MPAASGGEDEAAPAPLLPSVPRGSGDPVPGPGDTSRRGRAGPGRGAVGSGAEPHAGRSCAAAPTRGAGRGQAEGEQLRQRRPPGLAPGAAAPGLPGRGREGGGRRRGGEAAKREISHLPRGGRRLREAAPRRRQLPPSPHQRQRRARGRGAGTRWPGGAGSSPAARAGLRGPLCALCCTPRLCTGFRGLCRLPGRKLLSISHVCTREEKAVFNLQVYFCRQLTAAPGTFPCLELNFARAEF